jgi:serine/threonine protein kinase
VKLTVFRDSEGDILPVRNTKDVQLLIRTSMASPPSHSLRVYVLDVGTPLRVFDINALGLQSSSRLGRGGDAAVFKATLTLAVKRLEGQRDLLDDRKKGSFLPELDIPFRCDHPNILNVYGYGIANDEHLYLLLALKDFTLDKLILPQIRQRLLSRHLADICIQILRGLAYLHKMEIGHANLKMENILVEEYGGVVTVVLSDFGRSQEMRDTLRRVTKAVSTSVYSAPETFDDMRGLPSGMYSFGLIAWELYKGQRVDFGSTPNAICKRVTACYKKTFADLLRNNPDDMYMLSDFVKEFLPHCWAENPSSRFTALRALLHLEGNAHHFGSFVPVTVPEPHNSSAKRITAYIRSIENYVEVTSANINPVEATRRTWRNPLERDVWA